MTLDEAKELLTELQAAVADPYVRRGVGVLARLRDWCERLMWWRYREERRALKALQAGLGKQLDEEMPE
jgi:hypothetical protein